MLSRLCLLLALMGLLQLPAPAQLRPPGPAPHFGPWNRDLYLAESADGLRFGGARRFVERAGVPCVLRDRSGRLVAVFQWFPMSGSERLAGFDRVAVAFSADDGRTWSTPRTVEVTGLPEGYQRPYDPTLVQLEDGRFRLYFTSQPRGERGATYSAVSGDALRYTFEPGARFQDPGRAVVDASLARLDGKWHLFAPVEAVPGRAYHAVSPEGLAFTRLPDIQLPGSDSWIGNPGPAGGGLRFYGSGIGGGWSAFSRDGAAWKLDSGSRGLGGDPCVVETRDARWLALYTGDLRPDAAPEAFSEPAAGGALLAGNGEFLYVLRGDRLYQYEAGTLRAVRSTSLPPAR